MRKHFLLLLWLTLLPLAGWAQDPSYEWTSGAPDITYGDAIPNLGNLVTVLNGYSNYECTNAGEGTDYTSTTDYNNRFRWAIFDADENQVASSSKLNAGEYTLNLYIRHRSSGGGFVNVTRSLTFTVKKRDVTISLYQVVREWKAPWEDPDLATLDASAYKVTGGDATWDKILPALSWNQLQLVEHVGSYKYTLDVNNSNAAVNNYTVHIDGGAADLKIEKNTSSKDGLSDATGKALNYDPTKEQQLEPTAAITFKDSDGNDAGKIEYKLSTETEWSEEIPTAKDAGTYTVEYRGIGDQDHVDASATKSYSVTIARVTITDIAAWEAYFKPAAAVTDELIYTGSAQALITPAEILDAEVFKDATISYRVGTGGAWGATNYSATNAQNETAYNVYYQISGAKNFETFTSPAIQKVIKKATPEVTLPKLRTETGVYNGSTIWRLFEYPDANVGSDFGTLQFRGGTYTTGWTSYGNIAATNAGDYDVEYRVQGTQNWNEVTGVIEGGKVLKADPALNAASGALATLEFNGKDQVLVATNYTVTGGTIQYYVDGDFKGARANVQAKNAGKYKIAYKITGNSNYNDYPADADADPVEIGEAEITKATLNFGVNNLEVDWADGKTYEWAAIVKDLVTSDDWLDNEDDAAQAAILAKALTITVNGGAAEAGNEAFDALLAGDAGTYNIALAANDDAEGVNYKIKLYNSTSEVKINKIDATLAVLADAGKTYNGEDQDLVTITTAAVGADKVMYIVGGDTAPEADSEAWAEGIPQETNANTYNVWQKVVGDKNHNDVVATAAVVGTIAPKNIADAVFTIDPAEKVYTGENQNTTEITVVPDDAEPMDVDKDIKSITLPADVTSFGEYDVTIEGQGNYTGTTTVKFSITQAENKAEVTIAGWTYGEYDEEVNAPKVTADFGAETVKYTYSVKDADDWKDEVPTEFGTYTVKAYIAETADYAEAVAYADFDIAKANAVIDPATAAINLTYNGKDQALVKAAGSADGTFKYFIGETAPDADSEEWSDAIPQAKDAGEYTVQTLFIPDGNHNGASVDPVTVTINKAEISYVLGNISKVWDGEPFDEEQINSLFAINNGELFEDDKYDRPFEFILPDEYKDAGEYSFTDVDYKFKKTKEGDPYPENYDVKFTGTANIVINKADIYEGEGKDYIAPAAIKTNKYEFGTLMDLVTPGTVNTTYLFDGATEATPIGTILFATEEDGEYTEDVPQGALAKDYVVWYYVKGDKNHNDTKPVKIDATIAQYELTEAFLPEGYEDGLVKPYKAAAYAATDFISALDGIELDEGYTVTPSAELKDAGKYTLTYAGINNLSGGFTVDVEIEALKVVASAPKGVKKVYDGTASLEGIVTNEDISFNGVLDTDKLVLPTTLALSTEGINVSDESYAIKVDASAFEGLNKNYIISDETIDGDLTITKAPAIKIGIATYPASDWTKVYGEEDPELTGYTLAVTGGEVFADDLAKVLEASTAKRAGGDDVDTYAVSLEFDETAEVFANYDGVSFDEEMTGEFTITKSTKTYTVSLANITETYTGEEFATAIEFDADDLVIAGYTGDKAKFFDAEGLPTASIAAGAKTVGDYNITLAGGESKNFKFEFIPATFTIEPFKVTEAKIENQQVVQGKELDVTAFTITAPAADAAKFYVTAPGLVDMDDIVTGAAGVYEDGLVIAVDASVAANYTGLDAFTADLEIIGIADDAVVLADNEDFANEKKKEGVDVTFASRSLNAGNWNVIALPFEATIAQISNAFGYAAVDVLDKSNAKTNEIHFMITTTGSIPAYTPFIVKTTNDEGLRKTNFDQVVFNNVTIEAGDGENKAISDAAGNKFWGTFKAETKIWGEKYRYMAGGAWYNAINFTEANPAIVKAFRGYIEMVEAGARIFIEEPDGTVTAIDAVEFNKGANEGMYNLNGVKVNNANRKGVFIQNGKKVIKK